MVQVDVFWSYGIGAGFAASAALQIQKQEQAGGFRLFESSAFTRNLIFLGALFAPSGLCLLWAFPGWETMYVARSWADLPAWLVAAFAVTNVTQGILGFWITALLIRRGRLYAAHLQWIFAYLAMFFILVHGWDGAGYRRFFTRTVPEWQAGSDQLWIYLARDWATCPVALTLYAMGVIMLPLMFYWMGRCVQEGNRLAEKDGPGSRAPALSRWGLVILRVVLIEVLGAVIVGHLLIQYSGALLGSNLLGWLAGLGLWAALLYFLFLRPGGLFQRETRPLIQELSLAPAD